MRHFLIFCLLSVCFVGCGKPASRMEEWRAPNGKPKVLCTTPIIDDLVSRIGRERIDHLSLMGRSTDPHSYELVKGDDEKFAVAQLIFCNGLGLEHSASLKAKLMKHPHALFLGDVIHADHPTLILQEKGVTDPHIWLDVTIWEKSVDPIAHHLSLLDPAGKEFYERSALQVKKELNDLDQWMQDQLKTIPAERKYLVTTHEAFSYFARRYLKEGSESWKNRSCAPEGLAPDGQLGFQDLHRVIEYLEEHQVSVIFPESNVSRDSLKKIVEICHAKQIPMKLASSSLFSDTMPDCKSREGSYDAMMRHNVTALCEAWSH